MNCTKHVKRNKSKRSTKIDGTNNITNYDRYSQSKGKEIVKRRYLLTKPPQHT